MTTIYRGYDIKRNGDGTFGLHSAGSFPVITETFPTEEKAMDHIDALRRRRLAGENV